MNRIQKAIASLLGIKQLTTTLRHPADWLLSAFGVMKSKSGAEVSHRKALGLSPYFCGVRMISETVGSLPLNVYKRRPKRGRDVWRQHPAHDLLHARPNPEMTAMSLRQTLCHHAIGHGNAYAEIQRRANGDPFAIWPILPDRVRPRRDENGELWYEIRLDEGGFAYLPSADVLHVPGLGYDGIVGYSLIQIAAESIGTHLSQEEYSARFFSNGGHVSLVAETDNTLKPETFERLSSELAKKVGGLTNAHRIALLEAGIKLKTLNVSNVDAQLLEGKRFSIEEWARWLNMPPHKLKEMSHATFSNIEHQNIEWVVDTIMPWLIRFEQEYNRKLFRDPSTYYAKHVVDGLLRGDQKSRYDSYAVGRNWGWLSADDVLEYEDRNPLPNGLGEIYLVPGNMTRAEDAGKMMKPPDNKTKALPEPETDENTNDERARALTHAAARRVVNYELRQQHKNGMIYQNTGTFINNIVDWLATSEAIARQYVTMTHQMSLIQHDHDIPLPDVINARIELLTNLVMNGGRHETQTA